MKNILKPVDIKKENSQRKVGFSQQIQRKDILGEMEHTKIFSGKGWDIENLDTIPLGWRIR